MVIKACKMCVILNVVVGSECVFISFLSVAEESLHVYGVVNLL